MRADAAYLAKLNAGPYKRINTIYGGYVDTYRAHAPRSLVLAHILRTNPTLAPLPEGVMRVDIAYAKNYQVPKENLINDVASIYVFCRGLNQEALYLYTTHSSLFVSPYRELWKCAYLRLALRPRAFDIIWTAAHPQGNAYEAVLDYVANTKASIVDWPVRKLKRFVLYDCEFAIKLAEMQGPLTSVGPGVEPIPPADHMDYIFGGR